MSYNQLIKTKSKLQQQKVNIKNVFITYFVGNFLILSSGFLPFVHAFVKDVPLKEKFFGFTSVHRFLYSAGIHVSFILLVIGVLVVVNFSDKSNINSIKKNLYFSMISPFISGVFFLTWVFIPNVNYNFLAYASLGIIITLIIILISYFLYKYLINLIYFFRYKEMVLNEGLEIIESNLE